jgi:hypothetical protein
MLNYLSNDRYRVMGFGADLDGIEEVELANILTRSTAVVNAYCAAPMIPQPFSFTGGTITGEQHKWTLGTEITKGTRRVYPYSRPIKNVTDFRIKVTNQISAVINARDLFINNTYGYIEVVSLAAVVYGVYPVGVVPNLGLYQPVAEINYEYGWEFPVTTETLYATDGLTYRSQHGFWEANSATIYEGGTATTSGIVDYVDGTVTFPYHPATTVTASYTYTLPSAVEQATGEVASTLLAERELTEKGMRGLAGIQIAEVHLRRSFEGGKVSDEIKAKVSPTAQMLLEPYRFITIR